MKNYSTIKRSFPKWTNNIKEKLNKINIPSKLIFFILGIVSTIWFLVRVIPKPSRATYPCMKTAAPFMSAFIIYLLSLGGSAFAFKKARAKLIQSKYITGITLLIASIVSITIFISTQTEKAKAKVVSTDHLAANQPIGTGQGIFPGRVVWVHDKDATNINCTNSCNSAGTTADDDGYFLPANTDQTVVNTMADNAIQSLGGENTVADSWDAIFKYFNNKKHSTNTGYTTGEKIFIKINTTSASWMSNNDLSFDDSQSWKRNNYAIAETSPQTIYAILDQLVNDVGVAQSDIYVGDPISHVWEQMYDYLHADFPNVLYVDKENKTSIGRTTLIPYPMDDMTYSDNGTVMTGASTDKFYMEMRDADYLINLAALKGHARAGITLCAKNHFGSHTRSDASHLHPGLIAPDNVVTRDGYGLYRVQVDLMGNDYLGGNTVLFFVDGLWGGPHDTKQPVKWQMYPFSNDWPNSLFMSLDQVALESVCFDFLRTEFDGTYTYPELNSTFEFPNYDGVDDYLEQAADPTNWPTGITYAPSGVTLTSLGVHEHWSNSVDKSYKRNLGGDEGIELVSIPSNLVVVKTNENQKALNGMSLYPVPARTYTTLQLNTEYIGIVKIEVLDISGKQLNAFQTTKTGQLFNYNIDLNNITSSNLIIRISGDNFTASKQIVKI